MMINKKRFILDGLVQYWIESNLPMKGDILKKTIYIGLIFYGIYIFYQIFSYPDKYQWDFKTYYYAGIAYVGEVDPYDTSILSRLADESVQRRFVYPPISLYLFQPMILLDYRAAYILFFILKLICLGGLFYLWKKEFLQDELDIWFYPLCLLAFNNALMMDLTAGNISIFEQLLLWAGFYFFLKNRYWEFCLLILLASLFKLTPIFFLLLLFFSKDKNKIYYFIGTAASFIILQSISYFTRPELFHRFIHNSITLDERGIDRNSAIFPFLKDLSDKISGFSGLSIPELIIFLIYGMVIIGVIGITIRYAKNYFISHDIESIKIKIYLFCILYALLLPRFKDYSYILLLVPAYYLLKRSNGIKSFIPLFLILILSPGNIYLPGLGQGYIMIISYYPLFLAYLLWGYYLSGIKNYPDKLMSSKYPA